MKYKIYVDNVMEYSRRKRKDAAWQKIRTDLIESEKRMRTGDRNYTKERQNAPDVSLDEIDTLLKARRA